MLIIGISYDTCWYMAECIVCLSIGVGHMIVRQCSWVTCGKRWWTSSFLFLPYHVFSNFSGDSGAWSFRLDVLSRRQRWQTVGKGVMETSKRRMCRVRSRYGK